MQTRQNCCHIKFGSHRGLNRGCKLNTALRVIVVVEMVVVVVVVNSRTVSCHVMKHVSSHFGFFGDG